MKEFRIILEEREIDDDLEPISRKTVANQYMSSPIEDDEYYEYAIKQMCQDTIDKFIEQKDKMPSVPIKSINDHDRELVKEVCEKISIELENETETYCEIRQCTSPHYQGDYVWFNYVKFRKFIDQIQKEFEK